MLDGVLSCCISILMGLGGHSSRMVSRQNFDVESQRSKGEVTTEHKEIRA